MDSISSENLKKLSKKSLKDFLKEKGVALDPRDHCKQYYLDIAISLSSPAKNPLKRKSTSSLPAGKRPSPAVSVFIEGRNGVPILSQASGSTPIPSGAEMLNSNVPAESRALASPSRIGKKRKADQQWPPGPSQRMTPTAETESPSLPGHALLSPPTSKRKYETAAVTTPEIVSRFSSSFKLLHTEFLSPEGAQTATNKTPVTPLPSISDVDLGSVERIAGAQGLEKVIRTGDVLSHRVSSSGGYVSELAGASMSKADQELEKLRERVNDAHEGLRQIKVAQQGQLPRVSTFSRSTLASEFPTVPGVGVLKGPDEKAAPLSEPAPADSKPAAVESESRHDTVGTASNAGAEDHVKRYSPKAEMPPRRHHGSEDTIGLGAQALQLMAMIAVAVAVATLGMGLAALVRHWSMPFCDTAGLNEKLPYYSPWSQSDTGGSMPASSMWRWGSSTLPGGECIPCPPHGACSGGQLLCHVGYERLGRQCVRDRQVENEVANLAGPIRDCVCGRRAKSMCEQGCPSEWVAETEVWEMVRDKRLVKGPHGSILLEDFPARGSIPLLLGSGRVVGKAGGGSNSQGPFIPGPDSASVEDSWRNLVVASALQKAAEGLQVREDIDGVREFRCPDDCVWRYLPIWCRLRKWLASHWLVIVMIWPVVLLALLRLVYFLRRRSLLAEAERLFAQVCAELEALSVEAQRSSDMGGNSCPAWTVAAQVRDHLLPAGRRRGSQRLWKEVERLVREDSRIACYPMVVRGVDRTVWEWQAQGALLSPALRRHGDQSPRQPAGTAAACQPGIPSSYVGQSKTQTNENWSYYVPHGSPETQPIRRPLWRH